MINFDPYGPLTSLGDGKSVTDGNKIADNFDTFLTLLTTQLKHQNPLDPLDTNDFTSQLVEFTSVEQAIQTNKHLEDLAKLSAANAITGAVSFIGKRVAASGSEAQLQDGQASWVYFMGEESAKATFVVKDSSGNEIFSQNIEDPAQEGVFTWNGKNADGTFANSGTYSVSITAERNDGSAVSVTTNFTGVVNQVDMESGAPVLKIGDRTVKLENVIRILEEPTVEEEAEA